MRSTYRKELTRFADVTLTPCSKRRRMLARSPFSAAPMRLFIPSDLRALVGLRVALVAGRWLGPTAI